VDQKTQQVKKKTKWVTVKLLVVVALFLLTLFIFWMIADEIVLEHESRFDSFIFKKLALINSPEVTRIMLLFTFLGSSYFLLPCYILLTSYYLFFKKNSSLTLNVCAIGLSSTGLLFLIKDIFRRPRPLDPLLHSVAGFSFPSGHSFSAFTFFGLIAYILWQTTIKKKWKWILSGLCLLLAICIATSRVYLHVHYASDVVAGFCLSMVWLIISLFVLNKIDKKYFTKSAHATN
jgi:undecaprenyl-diphosphatase